MAYRHIAPALALFVSLAGCGTAQPPLDPGADPRVEEALQAPGQARATTIALAGLAVQAALYHVSTALLESAAKEFNQAATVPITALIDPKTQTSYELDPASGTGRLRATRNGRLTMDLRLRYDQARMADGVRTQVSSLAGTVEGFELSLPAMTFVFTAPPGQLRSYQVNAQAGEGSLGYQGQVDYRVERVALAFEFPPREGRLGSFGLVSTERPLSLESELIFRDGSAMSRGVVSNAAGEQTHEVITTLDGMDVKPL